MELLSIENHTQLATWMKKSNYKEFNANVHTMLMWQNTYPVYFIVQDHFALACFKYNDTYHWFAPYCEAQYLKEATDFLISYSKEHHIPLGVHSITQSYKDFLEETYANEVYFENHVSGQDYIYDRAQQETLVGKKMQKRRNHYNAFLKEYENRFSYFPLSKEHFTSIYELLAKWQQSKEESESIQLEDTGIHYLLDHYDELDILGGCLYIDGVLQAFSIASYISEDMIQIHVEKANREIRGLYVAILKHFLETLPETTTLVNREDDMGLDSLRKAKRDMRPLYQVKKYFAVFGHVSITHPTKDDVNAMKDLWHNSFAEENEATTTFFFENIMQYSNAYIMKNSEGIMAMAFLNEWSMMLNGNPQTVYFLEGVATQDDYKRCGVMRRLLQHIQHEHQGDTLALQAYDWNVYRSFGFEETHFVQKGIIDNTTLPTPVGNLQPCEDAETLSILYQSFVDQKDGYRIRDISYYAEFYIPYQKACGTQISIYENDKAKGYVTYYCKEDTLYVEEIIYQEEQTLHTMLACLAQHNDKVHITMDTHVSIPGLQEEIMLMMNKPYTNENAFINEYL